jgi:molecular chaperone GrpE
MTAGKKKESMDQVTSEDIKEKKINDEDLHGECKEIEQKEAVEPDGGEEKTELQMAEELWQKEKEELLDNLKRKQADIDNLRRISRLEQAEAREYALHQFLCKLLPVLDNIERGIESAREADDVPPAFVEGLEMIQRQLVQIFEQEEVNIINSVGERFDPNCHHAVMQVESEEVEPGTIVEELQKGYRHRQRILRPAMVKVCKE